MHFVYKSVISVVFLVEIPDYEHISGNTKSTVCDQTKRKVIFITAKF